MVWFKGNKAGEKWTEKEAETVLAKTLKWIDADSDIKLQTEVELYLLRTHGVGTDTHKNWVNVLYIKNKSIQQLWSAISLTLENRVVCDQTKMRPAIQGMVLQNKHDYRERKEIEQKGALKLQIAKTTLDEKRALLGLKDEQKGSDKKVL